MAPPLNFEKEPTEATSTFNSFESRDWMPVTPPPPGMQQGVGPEDLPQKGLGAGKASEGAAVGNPGERGGEIGLGEEGTEWGAI